MGVTVPGEDQRPATQQIRVDVYHHFPEGIPVAFAGQVALVASGGVDVSVDGEVESSLAGAITVTLQEPAPAQPVATHARLVVTPTQGANMPGQITVDTTNETAVVEFLDDHGDTNAAAPVAASGSPLVVTFSSDTPTVATIATDSSNPLQGDVTPVGEGTANLSATLAYEDGSPVLEADGVTPFPQPGAVAVTVSAGAAVGDALSLSV
jgi:hypothetical protein